MLLELRLDERALLLDDDDVLEPARKLTDADRFERPRHADLVDTHADIARLLGADAEIFERLQHVEIALAGRDDAEPSARRIDDDAIDAVRSRECDRSLHGVAVQPHFLIERRIRPADVEAARRQREIGRHDDVELMRIDVHARARLDGFRDRLETDPAPGEARHRPTEQAHVENVLHTSGIQHRHHRRDELELRAVRQRRRAARMIVRREREHAAVLRRASRVAVLEHIAAAIDARALAVPHREHAVVLRARKQVRLLRAPDHRRAEILVEARREFDVGRLEVFLRLPELEVEATERRAAVAGDEARGVEGGGAVTHLLHQRQADEGLDAREIDAAGGACVFVVEGVVAVNGRDGRGRCVDRHEVTAQEWPRKKARNCSRPALGHGTGRIASSREGCFFLIPSFGL